MLGALVLVVPLLSLLMFWAAESLVMSVADPVPRLYAEGRPETPTDPPSPLALMLVAFRFRLLDTIRRAREKASDLRQGTLRRGLALGLGLGQGALLLLLLPVWTFLAWWLAPTDSHPDPALKPDQDRDDREPNDTRELTDRRTRTDPRTAGNGTVS